MYPGERSGSLSGMTWPLWILLGWLSVAVVVTTWLCLAARYMKTGRLPVADHDRDGAVVGAALGGDDVADDRVGDADGTALEPDRRLAVGE